MEDTRNETRVRKCAVAHLGNSGEGRSSQRKGRRYPYLPAYDVGVRTQKQRSLKTAHTLSLNFSACIWISGTARVVTWRFIGSSWRSCHYRRTPLCLHGERPRPMTKPGRCWLPIWRALLATVLAQLMTIRRRTCSPLHPCASMGCQVYGLIS